jgi:hypothetical protein
LSIIPEGNLRFISPITQLTFAVTYSLFAVAMFHIFAALLTLLPLFYVVAVACL